MTRRARSIDGRRFAFAASLDEAVPIGSDVCIETVNGRTYLGQLRDEAVVDGSSGQVRASFGKIQRRLGMRIANLGVVGLSIWGRAGDRAVRDQLPDDWRMLVFYLGSLPSDRERSIAAAVLGNFWYQRAERIPLLIVIDEAHNICPQTPTDPYQELAAEHAVKIAGEGRKFGKYLLPSTQRPEKLHQNVLSQCDNLALMRMNSVVDLEQLKRIFSFVPPSVIEQASGFGLGDRLAAGKIAPDPIRFKTGRRLTLEGGSDVPLTWVQRR